MLPENLILIRHGESEGNVALSAEKNGDLSHYTEHYVNKPDTLWELSEKGAYQAKTAGDWIVNSDEFKHVFEECSNHETRQFYVSPLRRTLQTAGNLNLPDVLWRKNRSIRERDWGEISTITKVVYRKEYPNSVRKEENDPLYWRPPGGESIADVSENRVRNFFNTLHRLEDKKVVFAVTHGEFIRATHLTLTRGDDELYRAWEKDRNMKIANCEIFHYTRIDPNTGFPSPFIKFFRRFRPVLNQDNKWNVEKVQDWTEITFKEWTNDELLNITA